MIIAIGILTGSIIAVLPSVILAWKRVDNQFVGVVGGVYCFMGGIVDVSLIVNSILKYCNI